MNNFIAFAVISSLIRGFDSVEKKQRGYAYFQPEHCQEYRSFVFVVRVYVDSVAAVVSEHFRKLYTNQNHIRNETYTAEN